MGKREHQANIKRTKEFIALWVKFHDLYKNATQKEAITQKEEDLFLDTKSLITDKYDTLKRALNLKPSGDNGAMDVTSHVLSLKGMTAISDEALNKIEESWKHSYAFLNKLLKNLESRTPEFKKRRRFSKFLKNVFSKKPTQFIILVLAVFIMAYGINVLMKILTK